MTAVQSLGYLPTTESVQGCKCLLGRTRLGLVQGRHQAGCRNLATFTLLVTLAKGKATNDSASSSFRSRLDSRSCECSHFGALCFMCNKLRRGQGTPEPIQERINYTFMDFEATTLAAAGELVHLAWFAVAHGTCLLEGAAALGNNALCLQPSTHLHLSSPLFHLFLMLAKPTT